MAASIPSHIIGAMAGSANRFAGSAAIDTAPKWCANRGAVARVAAIVTPAPSARARRAADGGSDPSLLLSRIRSLIRAANTRMPVTAAKLSCQLGSPADRGLSARVSVAARRSAYHRHRGRPARAAITPAAPMMPARWIEGPAPATGT